MRPPSQPSPIPLLSGPAERAIRTRPSYRRGLAERKCRLFCETAGCGYDLSCADSG